MLVDSELISRIQISIDATNSETYNNIRIGGITKELLKNINYFMEYKKLKEKKNFPFLRLNFLSIPESKGQEEDFLNLWKPKVDAVGIKRSVLKPGSKREKRVDEYKLKERLCPNPFRKLIIRAYLSILPCCSFWGCNIKLSHYDNKNNDTLFDTKLMKNLRNTFIKDNKKFILSLPKLSF